MTADPTAVYTLRRPGSTSPWLVICEHASAAIPVEYGELGLAPEDRYSHIAWDPGAAGVAEALADRFEATVVLHRYSRLLYDCNRTPESIEAIRTVSENRSVPGNAGLDLAARRARMQRFYTPFHRAIETLLDERAIKRQPTAIVTVHSFTPVFHGVPRSVELGIISDSDNTLGIALFRQLIDSAWQVELDAPYSANDGVTHTARRHGTVRNLPTVMLEIRNDLIASAEQQDYWGGMLAVALDATGLAASAAHAWRWSGFMAASTGAASTGAAGTGASSIGAGSRPPDPG